MSRVPGKAGELPALEHEIAGEMAAALGRSGRRLEAALQRLREHDAGLAPASGQEDARRAELLVDAADAYWCHIVQREAMGLSGTERVADDYEVPLEVRRHAGPKRR